MTRRLIVDTGPLARVEGEGSLLIESIDESKVDVKLNIFEPPRYYEAFLKGRKVEDAVDIVSRICGICPVAYQMSALNAIESLYGIEVDEQVRRLRRLLYYGEWIESHALHIFMLATPDFLKVPDVVAVAKGSAELVRKALTLKKLGNSMMIAIGGREIHPVSLRIGGIHKAASKQTIGEIASRLDESLGFAKDAVKIAASFEKPELKRSVTLVSLRDPRRYAISEGDIVSNTGIGTPPSGFEENFVEHQVDYSNALRSLTKAGGSYMVGPLARVNLNFTQLNPAARSAAEEVGFRPPVTDPFQSVVARAVELVHAIEEIKAEALEYSEPVRPWVSYEHKTGRAFGVSEAPRGILYHRYDLDRDGRILRAKIVPPTAQNLVRVEDDVRQLAPQILAAPPDEARRLGEMAVRNYDPCISCSTHFINLRIKRS
ncbi:MAG TPA: Ni/Fe hydrogenase subunit alpha [Nitrososphaerales archaeon]|nr:Ni/Fe hydrogenase subunit alpha [Nitrososphaerales archaeon]